MNTFTYTPQLPRISRTGLRRTLAAATCVPLLSGCLLTSPYWNQVFDNHTDSVPMQAWTTIQGGTVKFECAQAGHGGLYPFGAPVWQTVANVSAANSPSYDPSGAAVYSAGISQPLPAACWRQDPANSQWYAAVRASHQNNGNTTTYYTLDKVGLACMGEENGKAESWFGWLSAGCYLTYSNSSTPLPYVIIRAPG